MILLTPHLTTVHAAFLQLQEFIYSLKIQTHTCFFFFGPYDPHIFAPSLICGFTVKPLLQCNTTQRRLACGGVCRCQKRCLLCLHFFQAAIRSVSSSITCHVDERLLRFLFSFSRNSGEGFKVEILTPKTVNCDCLTDLLTV